MPKQFHLQHRSVVEISGSDRFRFLQGLMTNDVEKLKNGGMIYAALLTPQGRFQFDLFCAHLDDVFLVDIDAHRMDEFIAKIKPFKLRQKVEITKKPDLKILQSEEPSKNLFPDPRVTSAGYRGYSPEAGAVSQGYDTWRIPLGLPDIEDFLPDRSIILEYNFNELHAISWDKGCYMGQELIARTFHTGQIRKRLVPVTGDHHLIKGQIIRAGEKEVGEVLSCAKNWGLAMVRLESIKEDLRIEDQKIAVRLPHWLEAHV